MKTKYDPGLALGFQRAREELTLLSGFILWFLTAVITGIAGLIGLFHKIPELTTIGFVFAGTATVCYLLWLAGKSFD